MAPLPDGGWKADALSFAMQLPKCAKPRDLAAPGLRTGCEKPMVARGHNAGCIPRFHWGLSGGSWRDLGLRPQRASC